MALGAEDEDEKVKKVLVPPIVRVVKVPVRIKLLTAPPSAVYQTGYVENGYGSAFTAGVTVQIGGTGVLNFDFTVNAISYESFNKWHSTASQYLSTSSWSYLNEHYDASAEAGGFFGGFFGAAYANGNYNHYKNTGDSFQSNGTQTQDGAAQSVYNLTNSTLHITGQLTVVGQSYIPVTATGYIQVTKITFSDQHTLYAVDAKNPIAADQNGDTSGVVSKPTTLHIVTT